MGATTVRPDPLCFGRTALELNPRLVALEPGTNGRAGLTGLSATIAFRNDDLRKKTRRRLGRLEELLDEESLHVDLRWRADHASGLVRARASCLRDAATEDKRARLFWRTLVAGAAPRPEPRLLGILNVTPDSFSDGGRFLDPFGAVEQGRALVAAGADALDVGGESTRPGAEPVAADEERARVLPVIEGLRAAGIEVPISIDTQKASVAEAALDAGADWINDVSAGRTDPDLLALAAERRAGLCLMHMRGTPRDMQEDPRYADVVEEVLAFLRERVAAGLKAGIDLSRIVVDPGIGFGKRLEHNLELLRRLPELRSLGLPLLCGVSRKSFIAHVNEASKRPQATDSERIGGTAAAVAAAVAGGATWLRVHDVRTMGEAMRVAARLRAPDPDPLER